jgi:hypothetical protein
VAAADPWRPAGTRRQESAGAVSPVRELLLTAMSRLRNSGDRAPGIHARPSRWDGPPTGVIVITATATATATGSLHDVLGLDFSLACCDLADARLEQAGKDSPRNRDAVAEVRGRIDALLDMYLDAVGHRR